jgi:hypothetical protein
VAVPAVPIVTVTSAVVAVDKVAVMVNDDPAFSAMDVSLTVNVTVGALSSSEIVIVTDYVPLSVALPPETLLIPIVAVSSPSYTLSLVGVKLTVPVVLPALIVISSIFPDPSV